MIDELVLVTRQRAQCKTLYLVMAIDVIGEMQVFVLRYYF